MITNHKENNMSDSANQDRSKEIALKNKCQKNYADFTNSQDGLSVEELEKNLLRYARYREETLMHKSKDENLKRAKETVAELNAPYQETLAALKLKMAYLNILLEEKTSNEEETQETQSAV